MALDKTQNTSWSTTVHDNITQMLFTFVLRRHTLCVCRFLSCEECICTCVRVDKLMLLCMCVFLCH